MHFQRRFAFSRPGRVPSSTCPFSSNLNGIRTGVVVAGLNFHFRNALRTESSSCLLPLLLTNWIDLIAPIFQSRLTRIKPLPDKYRPAASFTGLGFGADKRG